MGIPLPPGPKGHFLVGVAPEFQKDILSLLRNTARDYGDVALMPFGPYRIWLLSHPDYLHQVLVTDAAKFRKSRRQEIALGDIVGKGIFLSEGDFWKRQRRLVAPAFHSKRIGAYADVMVQETQRAMNTWGDDTIHNIEMEITELTLNIISETMFGSDVSEIAAKLSETLAVARQLIGSRFKAIFPTPLWIPTKLNRHWRRVQPELNTVIQRFIDERRATGEDRGDLLSMLLLAQDEDGTRMSDKQVFDEAITIFGAGHETTAAALTWAFYLISQHPDVEAKLHEEIDRVLVDPATGEARPAVLADLPRLKYTEMIFKETLRMYPPAFATSREPLEDVLIGGYTVRKQSPVVTNFYAVHYDPRFWDEPDHFMPERFSEENEKRIYKHAYIPFGAGPRICIGNSFAMMEGTLVLATIAQRYRLSLESKLPIEIDATFTLRPKHGMYMRVHQRVKELAAPAVS